MKNDNKLTRNKIRKNSIKLITASAIAISAVAPIGIAEKVEAASTTLAGKQIGDIVTIAGKQFYIVNNSNIVTHLMAVEQLSQPFDTEYPKSRTVINFDPTRVSNIAYYLNNTYYNSLPAELRKVILPNQKWYTGEDNAEMSTHVIANVGMLRLSEYKIFTPRMKDGKMANFTNIFEYTMTRSSENYDSNEVWQITSSGNPIFSSYSNSNALGVRPVIIVPTDLEVLANGTVLTNKAPSLPALTVPTQQFEHGDKQILGWDATDPDGDTITYSLQAAYNGSTSWENLYTGAAKSFTYTVPTGKTSVRFRVLANDGTAVSTGIESATKSIGAVTYHWQKLNAIHAPYLLTETDSTYWFTTEGKPSFLGYSQYQINQLTGQFEGIGAFTSISGAGNIYEISGDTLVHKVITNDGYSDYYGGTQYGHRFTTFKLTHRGTGAVTYIPGTFVENIQGLDNSYTNNAYNTDGFWYVKGQRTLAADTTPPIIELSEQATYGATSKVTVKTHDLGTVSAVKWAKGTQSASHFITSGTAIATGQSTASTFTVSENGTYTVYAIDTKGNASIQTVVVNKINTAPIINSLDVDTKLNVVDEAIGFRVYVNASDVDGQDLNAKATYLGNKAINSPTLELNFSGNNYTKGIHVTPITAIANDGIVDSDPMTLEGHIVIKVDSAADYSKLLAGHAPDANDFTEAKHQAFYNAYEAIKAYEEGRTETQYTTAVDAVDTLKTVTGIDSSATTAEWSERLNIVHGKELLAVAESSLDKADYITVKDVFNNLTSEDNKDLLKTRLAELTKYHNASDTLAALEVEINRHKLDPTTALDTRLLNTTKLNEAKALIALTQNTTEADYKEELTPRQTALQSYYLNNKNNLSPEDLLGSHPDVNSALTTEYDELKGAFKPIDGNIEHLVLYTNALVAFLESVDQTTKDAYLATIANSPSDTGIDFNALQKVTTAVESIYKYRSTFKESQSDLSSIETDIQAITIGGINTKGYMEEIRKAMKEVTEYNDVSLDQEHSAEEQQEALTQLTKLKVSSEFLTDMSGYIDNGIPVIIVNDNPYEYIVDNTIEVKGFVTDKDNTTHVVTVKLGADLISEVVVDGEFTITFTRPEGVYLNEALTINANDGLTSKAVTINGKPIISVSDPAMFTDLVKLLEADRGEDFKSMSNATLTELLLIFNSMVKADINTAPTLVASLYEQAKVLSTKDGSSLETFIKSFVQTTYLEWLYANYETATVEQFEIIGLTVAPENLDALKGIIKDYKVQADSSASVPTLNDYSTWIDLIENLATLDTTIAGIYDLIEGPEVVIAVGNIAKQIDEEVPNWSTLKEIYTDKLNRLKDFEKAIVAVAKSESDYTQLSYDEARTLTDSVVDEEASKALASRLVEVQKTITAIEAVEAAEVSKDLVDTDKAQLLIEGLGDSDKKTELQVRVNNVIEYDTALKALVKAEADLADTAYENAKVLVEALMDSTAKTVLLERVQEVGRIIEAVKALEKAELSNSDEDILIAGSMIETIATQPLKSNLESRLVDVSMYAEAVKSVGNSETSLDQNVKDEAKVLVDALPSSESKTRLAERLDDVQQIINTTKALEVAELSKADEDVAIANAELDKISNTVERERLQVRLDGLTGYMEASKAVRDSETSNKQSDKDIAVSAVNQLPASVDKDALLQRLEEVQKLIDRKSASDKAEDAVGKGSDTWNLQDVTDARILVETLEDLELKDILNAQLDLLEPIIAEYEKTKLLIDKVEASKLEEDLVDASTALDSLVTLVGSTHSNTDELQNRIAKVSTYINAEKAITKAENSKYQRHVDEAQLLIDTVETESDKASLQERLDILKESLIGKESDLLDRIIDGSEPITDQELADYTGQLVYKELMNDYLAAMREIGDETATLTKDDVVKVIRLINSFELAKRSMALADIQLYEIELAQVNNAIRSNYPIAEVMFATSSYLTDESKQMELVEGLAKLLGRDISIVLAEMEELLAGIEMAQSGFYSIKYIDADTLEVLSNEAIEAEFGTIEFNPSYVAEGYELVNNNSVTFELNNDNNGKVFSFLVKPTEVVDTPEEETKVGSYTLTYALEDGTVIDSVLSGNIELGDISVEATAPAGFELIGEKIQNISLTIDSLNPEVIVLIKALEGSVPPTITTGSYTVNYVTANNQLLKQTQFKDIALGEQQIQAEPFGDYVVATSEDTAKVIALTEKNSVQNITFIVEKMPAVSYSSTIGIESPILRSRMVASLDDSYLTYTAGGDTASISHQQYLYQAAQATVRVGAYLAKPTQQNLDSAVVFVNTNILNGSYKAQLLALLKYSAEELAAISAPDLTAIHPYVAPPAPVAPPTPSYTGGGWSDIQIPQGVGTTAVEEKVHSAVMSENGSISWVIENPLKTSYNLSTDDMKVSISFEKDLITSTKKLEVMWKYIGNQEYELVVLSDEKVLPSFNAEIALAKNDNFKYMHRKTAEGYKATPYKYKDGTFTFTTNKAGVFKFGNDKKTFKDIAKEVETKDAIEELASRLIIKGTSPDKFNPKSKVTRAEFAAMLARALGLEVSDTNTPFKDTAGKWHEKEIQALYEADIINGTSGSTFSPDTYLTREHAVSMLYRVLAVAEADGTLDTVDGKLPTVKSPTFKDQDKIARDAKVAIATLESLRLIQGSDGKFNPQDALTRSHLAKILAGALRLTGDL